MSFYSFNLDLWNVLLLVPVPTYSSYKQLFLTTIFYSLEMNTKIKCKKLVVYPSVKCSVLNTKCGDHSSIIVYLCRAETEDHTRMIWLYCTEKGIKSRNKSPFRCYTFTHRFSILLMTHWCTQMLISKFADGDEYDSSLMIEYIHLHRFVCFVRLMRLI